MSLAWEVTNADVAQILLNHGKIKDYTDPLVEEVFDLLDCDEIEEAVLSHDDFDDQCNEMASNIEEQLIRLGYIS